METKKALLWFSFAIVLSFSLGKECVDHSKDWNYLVFSQWWPQSLCYEKQHSIDTDDDFVFPYNDYKFRNDCVPAGVKQWTVHGLWPTVDGTPNPCYCNHSWKFDETQIEADGGNSEWRSVIDNCTTKTNCGADLKQKMNKQWISLPDFHETEHLWRHEWEKHGTCATSLEALRNQHAYFLKTLKLNVQYDLLKVFDKQRISPSDTKLYEVKDFEDAITKTYNVKGRVICSQGQDDDQYVSGVRICLNKSFDPIDCKVTDPEECRKGSGLIYPALITEYSSLFSKR